MDSLKCNQCESIYEIYKQEEMLIEGVLPTHNMDSIAIEAERTSIEDIDYVYYYFNKGTLPKIKNSGNAAGIPRQWCIECIIKSIEDTYITRDPHYGDGVYVSLHDDLKNANERVKFAHGEVVSNREYRAKFEVINSIFLKKIKNTGGVMRTIENNLTKDIIFLNNQQREVVRFKGIEKYAGGEWLPL